MGISEIVTNENQRNQGRTKRMQASWAVGVGKSEVWAIGGLFHMTGEAVESGRGALKAVQTVSLRSLPVARLAAGTLAFHGLIRSRLGLSEAIAVLKDAAWCPPRHPRWCFIPGGRQ